MPGQRFSTVISVRALDGNGAPITNVPVVFETPVMGASATWQTAHSIASVTSGSGTVLIEPPRANLHHGPFKLRAHLDGTGVTAELDLRIISDRQPHLLIVDGDGQTLRRGGLLSRSIVAELFDAEGAPLVDTLVTPGGPREGRFPSCVFTATAWHTDSNGRVELECTANDVAGVFEERILALDLEAHIHGRISSSAPVRFEQAGPDSIIAGYWTDALRLRVFDEKGDPAHGFDVSITTPLEGATCIFEDGFSVAITPAVDGVVTIPPCVASTAAGEFPMRVASGNAQDQFTMSVVSAP